MPISIYHDPKTNKWLQAQEAAKAGLNVSPEDIPVAVPEVVQQEQVKPTINPIESKYNSYNDPLYPLKSFMNPISDFVSNTAKSVGDTASDLYKSASETGSDLYKSASQTGNDISNWADKNRVGLGGFATAIGAGFAKRDASDALARYNQSIIQNKQQRQEEEKFKMATDSSHPYNQQFRELFARMLPDVTAKLGDRFGKMTVQNFKDAGLTDLLDVTQKQIEISKNDASSPISKRTRDMASSQYNIQIPENISANEVRGYIEASKTQNELTNKREEIGIKRDVADIKSRELADKLANSIINRDKTLAEKTALEQKTSQQDQIFPSQLMEQKAKAEVASRTQENQIDLIKAKTEAEQFAVRAIDPKSDLSIKSKNDFLKNQKKYSWLIDENASYNLIKEIQTKVIPDLIKSEKTNLTSLQRQAMQSNALLKVQAFRDKEANYRARLNNKLGYARLGETAKHNRAMEEMGRQRNERENLKFAYQNPSGSIPDKVLEKAGISKKDLSETVEYSTDVQNAKDLVNEFKDILTRKGRFKILSDAEIRGQLQTMRTRFAGIIKRKDVLGALDAGVLTYVDQLLADPTAFSNALKPNSQIISQANAFLSGLESEEKNYYLGRKFDPRISRDIGQFQILVRKAGQGDKEAYKKLRDTGYSQDQINSFYEKRFNVIGDEEE